MEFKAAKLRATDRYNRDVQSAWLGAALNRAPKNKKLPALKSLLAQATNKPQSVDELRSALAVMSGQYGIPMKDGRRKRDGQ